MATYPPPTETLPTFNSTVFTAPLLDALTIAEADARYLKFPISQGGETISGDLTVTGEVLTTSIIDTIDDVAGTLAIGTLAGRTGAIQIGTGTTGTGKTITINGLASANTTTINGGTINISGSGGQTTLISNTGILTLTNGSASAINIGSNKTGGNIDIGQSGGTASTTTINIGTGTLNTGAINIGNGNTTSSLPITIGNQTGSFGSVDIGSTTIRVGRGNCATNSIETSTGGTLNLKTTASSSGAVNMGTGMTSGTIEIGTANSSTTAINIGNGTGNKSITIGNVTATSGDTFIRGFTVAINPNLTTGTLNLGQAMTAGSITIGGTTGGTTTLTVNRPIAPAYIPSAIGATNIGYQTSSTNNTFTSAIAGTFEVMNTGSITAGVWMVEGCFVFSGATGGGRRMCLNTTSAVMIDSRTQGVATGAFAQLAVSSIFSFSTATTVYLNIDITAGLGGVGTNISTLRWTRLA